MKVILKENVVNLGRTGDLVNVSEGYARNFLLPRKLVVIAQEGNIKMIENQKKLLEKKRLANRAVTEQLAEKIAKVTVTLARKVGENDKLFGSVTSPEIVEALKGQGFTIERRMVQMAHPIKSLGVHSVNIELDSGLEVAIKVWVVKESEKAN